jgi:hypothetical protein
MKRLIEFPLEDGNTILVEVDEPEAEGGVVRIATRPGEVSERAQQTFEVALSKIRPIAENVIATLRGMKESPDEIGVDFGLKLNAGAGICIASVSTEANFQVSLIWKKKGKEN